mgnify:CR=1 FL=1
MATPYTAKEETLPALRAPERTCLEISFDNQIVDCSPASVERNVMSLGCDYRGGTVPEHERCYFERQKSICIHNEAFHDRYMELWDRTSTDDAMREFKKLLGDDTSLVSSSIAEQLRKLDLASANDGVAAAGAAGGPSSASCRCCSCWSSCTFAVDDLVVRCRGELPVAAQPSA